MLEKTLLAYESKPKEWLKSYNDGQLVKTNPGWQNWNNPKINRQTQQFTFSSK